MQQQDTEAQDIQVELENEYSSVIQAQINDNKEAEQTENYVDEVPQVQQDDIQQTGVVSAEQDQQEIQAQRDSIQFYDSPSNQNLVNHEIKLIPDEVSNNAEAQVVEEQQIVVENQAQEVVDENNFSETQSNNNADPNDVNF